MTRSPFKKALKKKNVARRSPRLARRSPRFKAPKGPSTSSPGPEDKKMTAEIYSLCRRLDRMVPFAAELEDLGQQL